MDKRTFAVRGMHCAACVGKVERALRGVPGVDAASVNLATERATVDGDPARADTAALASAVAAAGYELAEAPAPAAPGAAPDDREQAARAAEQRRLRARVLVGVVLSIPIVLGSMREIFPWAPAWLANSCTTCAIAARACRRSSRSAPTRRTSSASPSRSGPTPSWPSARCPTTRRRPS